MNRLPEVRLVLYLKDVLEIEADKGIAQERAQADHLLNGADPHRPVPCKVDHHPERGEGALLPDRYGLLFMERCKIEPPAKIPGLFVGQSYLSVIQGQLQALFLSRDFEVKVLQPGKELHRFF